jgi:hypothetical protein
MGDWYVDENDRWTYDEHAPSPPGVTALAPDIRVSNIFEKDDGSTYERPDPYRLSLFDDVDSTTIVDDDGPDDAA